MEFTCKTRTVQSLVKLMNNNKISLIRAYDLQLSE